jgi:DNA primase small subunit
MSCTNHIHQIRHCDLRGNHFEIDEGVNTVPEYAGIYLMCRGAVEYVGRV